MVTHVLDFKDVETAGQAFADEVFRVFKWAHPAVELVPMNTTPDVSRMISQAHQAGSSSPSDGENETGAKTDT